MNPVALEARLKAARVSLLVTLAASAFLLIAGLQPVADWPHQWRQVESVQKAAYDEYVKERVNTIIYSHDDHRYDDAVKWIEGTAMTVAALAAIRRADEIDREREEEEISLFGYTASRRRVRIVGPIALLGCVFVLSLSLNEYRTGLERANTRIRHAVLNEHPWILTSGINSWRAAAIWLLPAAGFASVIAARSAPRLDWSLSAALIISVLALTLGIYRDFIAVRRMSRKALNSDIKRTLDTSSFKQRKPKPGPALHYKSGRSCTTKDD